MFIGEYMTVFLNSDAVISSSIQWISIYLRQCLLAKSLWKMLGAFTVLHAWCIWFHCTTGSMQRERYDRLIELWMSGLTGDLSTYHGVNIGRCTRLVR